MEIALIIDRRRNTDTEDLVATWMDDLNADPLLHYLLPFERTSYEEMEALIADSKTMVEVVLRCLRTDLWWIGVGFGEVNQPLPSYVRASNGPAFWAARKALERAKHTPEGICVRIQDQPSAGLEDIFCLLKAA